MHKPLHPVPNAPEILGELSNMQTVYAGLLLFFFSAHAREPGNKVNATAAVVRRFSELNTAEKTVESMMAVEQ